MYEQLWYGSNSNVPYPGNEHEFGTSLVLKVKPSTQHPSWLESWGISTKATGAQAGELTVLYGRICRYSGGSAFDFSNNLVKMDPNDPTQGFLDNVYGDPTTEGTEGEIIEEFQIYQSGGTYIREYRSRTLKIPANTEIGIVIDIPVLGGTIPYAWVLFRSKRQNTS